MLRTLGSDVDLLSLGERLTWLWVLLDTTKQVREHFPDVLKGEPSDSVFSSIALVPGEYVGLGRDGWPFDAEEFLRRLDETA